MTAKPLRGLIVHDGTTTDVHLGSFIAIPGTGPTSASASPVCRVVSRAASWTLGKCTGACEPTCARLRTG